MSHQFLLIVPEGWTEIENAQDFFQNHASMENINTYASDQTFWFITSAMDNAGLLPAGMMVTNAKAFDAGDGPRMWVVFAPEA